MRPPPCLATHPPTTPRKPTAACRHSVPPVPPHPIPCPTPSCLAYRSPCTPYHPILCSSPSAPLLHHPKPFPSPPVPPPLPYPAISQLLSRHRHRHCPLAQPRPLIARLCAGGGGRLLDRPRSPRAPCCNPFFTSPACCLSSTAAASPWPCYCPSAPWVVLPVVAGSLTAASMRSRATQLVHVVRQGAQLARPAAQEAVLLVQLQAHTHAQGTLQSLLSYSIIGIIVQRAQKVG